MKLDQLPYWQMAIYLPMKESTSTLAGDTSVLFQHARAPVDMFCNKAYSSKRTWIPSQANFKTSALYLQYAGYDCTHLSRDLSSHKIILVLSSGNPLIDAMGGFI